jgi:hypothetical protein
MDCACIALILGSWWALLPGAVIAALFVIRTGLEDQMLQEELPGYKEYTQYRKTHFLTKEGSHAHCLNPLTERAAHENPKDIIPYDADDLSM